MFCFCGCKLHQVASGLAILRAMLIPFWVCPNPFMSGSLNGTIHTSSKEDNTLVESAHSKQSPHWAIFKSISLSQMSRHDWCIFKKGAVQDNQSAGLVGLLGLPLSVRFLWSLFGPLLFMFLSSSPVTIHIWSFIKDLRFTRSCFCEAVSSDMASDSSVDFIVQTCQNSHQTRNRSQPCSTPFHL